MSAWEWVAAIVLNVFTLVGMLATARWIQHRIAGAVRRSLEADKGAPE